MQVVSAAHSVNHFSHQPQPQVTFPSHMFDTPQLYSATFEAVAEGSQTVKAKGLTFELQGEGNLPQVSVEKPVLHNAQGHPLLLFKRLMVGTTQSLPLVVRNVGTIPATLVVTLGSGHESFSVAQPKVGEEEEEEGEAEGEEEVAGTCQTGPGMRQAPLPPPMTVKLGMDEVKELKVLFQPAQPDKCSGELQLKIHDNQFENLRVVLVGEGYKDDVAIDNIQSIMEEGVGGEGESVTSMQGTCSLFPSTIYLIDLPSFTNSSHQPSAVWWVSSWGKQAVVVCLVEPLCIPGHSLPVSLVPWTLVFPISGSSPPQQFKRHCGHFQTCQATNHDCSEAVCKDQQDQPLPRV